MTARNAERLGRLGVWTFLELLPAPKALEVAQQIEAWGYSALWLPEAIGRDPFSLISFLSAHTKKLVFATGIANIYARDAVSLRAIQQTVGELSGNRFVLGLGVSHAPMVAGLRGHTYGKPVATMRAYLEAMEKAPYVGPAPSEETPIVLAALRENMLKLAAERCAGAHPYNVTPEHTARAREILGSGPTLAPEQMVLRETEPSKARAIARKNLTIYLTLPNYLNGWRWLGFDDDDFANGGSDRLIDAVVAWGDEQAIEARIQAHYDAGADHVCIQPFRADGEAGPDLRLLEALAPRPAPRQKPATRAASVRTRAKAKAKPKRAKPSPKRAPKKRTQKRRR